MLQSATHQNWCPRRGEIYYCDLSNSIGSEQNGIRPFCPCNSQCPSAISIWAYFYKQNILYIRNIKGCCFLWNLQIEICNS